MNKTMGDIWCDRILEKIGSDVNPPVLALKAVVLDCKKMMVNSGSNDFGMGVRCQAGVIIEIIMQEWNIPDD